MSIANSYSGRAAEAAARSKANRIRKESEIDRLKRINAALVHVLKNVELLIRVNHPMNDGGLMHKDVRAALAIANKP